MKKYKLSVSKGQNKYTIVVSSETEEEAREKVHKEGYSILWVEEFSETDIQWEKFLFQVLDPVKKEVVGGKIIGNDIFKIYLKLRKELNYNVLYLFSEKDMNMDQAEKDKIMSNLHQQYDLFLKNTIKVEVSSEKKVDIKNAEIINDSFHLKKELDETYHLIEFVLKKLQYVIEDTGNFNITADTKEKIKEIYNSIVKIKKTTNIAKLRQVWELALVKIWEIELENIEKYQKNDARKLLKETNTLLKQIGSKQVFIEEGKDINKIIKNQIQWVSEFFKKLKNIKEVFKTKKVEIDTTSYSYLKTLLLLAKYKKKLSENTKEILSNIGIFIFPFWQNLDKKEYILLKRRVIQQNISLLTAKKSGHMYSYTYIKKGYTTIIWYFFSVLSSSRWYMFWIMYTYVFLVLLSFSCEYLKLISLPNINITGIFYFLLFSFLFVIISLSRNIFTLAINFVFFFFLFIFGVVNF